MTNSLSLLARILMALIFILSGYGKISNYDGVGQYMASMGVPGALLPLVILAELGGGLALATGFLSRWVALGLALFSVVTAFLFHGNSADQIQQIMFLKNLAMAGGLLMVTAYGPGAFSLDAKLFKR